MIERHVAARAAAYWAQEVTDRERTAIDDHVRTCAACRAAFDAVRVAMDAVSRWPREPTLPPTVADRIVASAARAGVHQASSAGHRGTRHTDPSLGRARSAFGGWTRGRTAAAVVAIACGAAGFALGRATGGEAGSSTTASGPSQPPATPADSTLKPFLLLLEERSWPPPRPLARQGYREWSGAIVAQARFVGAEKLTDEPGFRVESDGSVTRPDGPTRPPNVSGWYVVRARSYAEAIDWARRGPHLAYGSVLVREIER